MIKAFSLVIISLLASFFILNVTPKTMAFDFFGGHPNNPCNSQQNLPNRTENGSSPVCQPSTDNENPVVRILRVAATIVALIGGFLAVLMIIISGFQFVTSGGKDESVVNARRRITNSIIGLIVIALAWLIVRFVTDRVA